MQSKINLAFKYKLCQQYDMIHLRKTRSATTIIDRILDNSPIRINTQFTASSLAIFSNI